MLGNIYLCYDQIPGVSALREGKVWLIKLENYEHTFLIREMKHYISKLKFEIGDKISLTLVDNVSPKFGKCKLLSDYACNGDSYNEPGRRILLHRGTSENWSENCLILIPKEFKDMCSLFKRQGNFIKSCTIDESQIAIKKFLTSYPGRIVFELEFKGDLNEVTS